MPNFVADETAKRFSSTHSRRSGALTIPLNRRLRSAGSVRFGSKSAGMASPGASPSMRFPVSNGRRLRDCLLAVTESTVMLTDVTFAGDTWQSAVDFLRQNYPLIPALVIAELADTLLPSDVFRCGGCGIVWKPFRFEDTGALIRSAHEASRERQAWRAELAMAAKVSGEGAPFANYDSTGGTMQ